MGNFLYTTSAHVDDNKTTTTSNISVDDTKITKQNDLPVPLPPKLDLTATEQQTNLDNKGNKDEQEIIVMVLDTPKASVTTCDQSVQTLATVEETTSVPINEMACCIIGMGEQGEQGAQGPSGAIKPTGQIIPVALAKEDHPKSFRPKRRRYMRQFPITSKKSRKNKKSMGKHGNIMQP